MPPDLRGTFDEDPGLYDRARPSYPPELISDLVATADLGPGRHLVEIGPGTGQATLALAATGARVTAVELGAGLAGVLRGKIDPASADVRVVEAAFEAWAAGGATDGSTGTGAEAVTGSYDAIVAFTAWHWLDPTRRAAGVARLLRPGGALATVTTTTWPEVDDAAFARLQDCYERWDPATPPRLRRPRADDIPEARDEVDSSPLFEPALRRRYVRDVTSTTAEFLDVLRTYSGHIALGPERLAGLLGCLGAEIDRRHGGSVTKRYVFELRTARFLGG